MSAMILALILSAPPGRAQQALGNLIMEVRSGALKCNETSEVFFGQSIGDLNRVFYPRPIWEFGKGVTEDPIRAAGYPLSACTGVF